MQRFYKAFGFSVLLIIIDQVIKVWVKTHMTIGEDIPIIQDWVTIIFVENPGMAFGLEFGGEWGKLTLSIFRLIAIGGIGWYLYDLGRKNSPTIVMVIISMILAGAVGNMVDSAFYGMIFNSSMHQVAEFMPADGTYGKFMHGKVVDMFASPNILRDNFSLFRPIFNFADACITIAVVLVIFNWKHFVKEENKDKAPKENSEEV